MVAGPVSTVPPEGEQRRVLFRVFGVIEVTAQSYAADYQFAGAAPAHGESFAVHDGEVPAPQGAANPDDFAWFQQCRRCDDGCFRGAVRVPHFATGNGEPFDQLWGQASPPKIRRRTCSIESAGHIEARVGTVEIAVMWWSRIHNPRSSPERTVSRDAATKVAP